MSCCFFENLYPEWGWWGHEIWFQIQEDAAQQGAIAAGVPHSPRARNIIPDLSLKTRKWPNKHFNV